MSFCCPWKGLVVILLCAATATTAHAANILALADTQALSHHLNILSIGQELLQRGHRFTFLISDQSTAAEPVRSATTPGLEVLSFKGPPTVGTEAWFAGYSRDPQKNFLQLVDATTQLGQYLYRDNATIQHLHSQNYDLLLGDAPAWPAGWLADTLGIPMVGVSPLPLSVYAICPGNPIPKASAYAPAYGLYYSTAMTFWQRVRSYLQELLMSLGASAITKPLDAFVKETGQSFRQYETGVTNAAAVVVVSDWTLDYPRPVPPKVHMVGPLLNRDAEPLPADLDRFLRQQEDIDAVYVSLGTLLRQTEAELLSMARAFSELPNPVLWKLNAKHMPGNVTEESLNLSPNVKLINWAPQNDVLGHPAVKAFVMQGGINSLYEAVHHAKPVVTIPVIGDQPVSSGKAVYHGFGLRVTPSELVLGKGKPLQHAIERLLADPAFKANAVKVQKRLINKPRSGAQLAADVVERVLLTGGEKYLDTREHEMAWWQLSLLDVKLVLAVIVIVLLCVLCMLTWWLGVGIIAVGRLLIGYVTQVEKQKAP